MDHYVLGVWTLCEENKQYEKNKIQTGNRFTGKKKKHWEKHLATSSQNWKEMAGPGMWHDMP